MSRTGKSPQKACNQLFGQIRGFLNAHMLNIKPAEQDHFRELGCKELNIIEEYQQPSKKPPASESLPGAELPRSESA
jgi:hypothetical protein